MRGWIIEDGCELPKPNNELSDTPDDDDGSAIDAGDGPENEFDGPCADNNTGTFEDDDGADKPIGADNPFGAPLSFSVLYLMK